MTLSIVKIRSASTSEWDQIWQACDYATYFHSREWAEIWQSYTQGKIHPAPKLIGFSDRRTVLLPCSVQESFHGLAKIYLSSPEGTFGGWISEDSIEPAHADLLTNFLTRKVGNLVWRMNPYAEYSGHDSQAVLQPDETHTLALSDGFDALVSTWKKGNASMLRKTHKARKEGISVQTLVSKQDWLVYYQVYQNSLQRWGREVESGYRWELFETMRQKKSDSIKLWAAIYQNQIIAGALCFYAKHHVVYWHGAALSDFFNLRPINLLMTEIIQNACSQQYRWFDFNPSGGNQGVIAFKQSFGAKSLACPTITIETPGLTLLKTLRKTLSAPR